MALVVGTAGHIDHGKTSLVRALTGVDCDTLPQEKLRGISIEAGYASMPLPEGGIVHFVDVPGHARFIRHMAAGASAVDVLLLVVDVCEGLMPQSREHLSVAALLGVAGGIMVLAKCDKADAALIQRRSQELRAFASGTLLQDAPILALSSHSGEGIEALRAQLVACALEQVEQEPASHVYMPIDRVFTKKGHGLIVAGTMVQGLVRLEDPLMLYPGRHRVRVRGLASHKAALEQACGGRVACKLHGLDKALVERGQVLASPDSLMPSQRWLVRLVCLNDAPPIRHRAECLVHHATSRCAARVYLAEGEALLPGECAIAELRLEKPLCALGGSRFVLRGISPACTLGGGQVLQPLPGEFLSRRALQAIAPQLEDLDRASKAETLKLHCLLAGTQGLDAGQMLQLLPGPAAMREAILEAGIEQSGLVRLPKGLVLAAAPFALLVEQVRQQLEQLHKQHPSQAAFAREQVLAPFEAQLREAAGQALAQLLAAGLVCMQPAGLQLVGRERLFSEQERALMGALADLYSGQGLAPPLLKELDTHNSLPDVGTPGRNTAHYRQLVVACVRVLCEQGLLVRVAEGLYLHKDALAGYTQQLHGWFCSHPGLDTAQTKVLAGGLSRKYLIPLLEYGDARGLTIRQGNIRVAGPAWGKKKSGD